MYKSPDAALMETAPANDAGEVGSKAYCKFSPSAASTSRAQSASVVRRKFDTDSNIKEVLVHLPLCNLVRDVHRCNQSIVGAIVEGVRDIVGILVGTAIVAVGTGVAGTRTVGTTVSGVSARVWTASVGKKGQVGGTRGLAIPMP